MRRLGAISAFALFLSVPLWAQRGGGHAGGFGGGFHGGGSFHAGGFAGSHAGGFSGRSTFGGVRGGFAGPRVGNRFGARSGFYFGSNRTFDAPFLLRNYRGGRFGGDRFHRFGRFNNGCWGGNCGWGWGWGYPWYGYDPYLSSWWWDDYNFDRDYYEDQAAAQQWNEENLAEQEMLRREQADGDQDAYAPPRGPNYQRQPAPQSQETPAPPLPDTVLVYRDQHKQDVENYAIVGQTLWAFGSKTQKSPLSDLDIQATERANDERGLAFHIPAANQGQ
jgi:hypothetical protein